MTKQEKLEALVEQLKSRADVLAVILFGSYARGNSRPGSDIDLVVILSGGYKRAVEYLEGQAFEIIYVTEQGAIDYWQSNKHDAVSLWEVAQVLFDRDGTGERLQKAGIAIRNEGRPALSTEQIAHARFDQEDSMYAAEVIATSDPATATLLLSKKVSGLIDIYFDLNQKWIPAPKQQLPVLRKENPRLAKMLDDFYTATSIEVRIALAKSLIAEIFS